MKIEDFSKLAEPFPAEDIEWRLQSCGKKGDKFWGKVLAYITSRAVQERLDSVCGPDGWQSTVKKEGDAYICTLSIRVTHEDGSTEWISRADGSDATDIEPVKGGISGAVKRSAVLFGIGRYLYNLKDNWAIISDKGKYSGKTKEGEWFRWDPPALPSWALPKFNEQKFKELEQAALDYINNGTIVGDSVSKTEEAIKTKNITYLQSIINWCKKVA